MLVMMTVPAFSGAILVGAVAIFCIVSFVAGILGLKRGAASMILSILGLLMALYLSLGALLAHTLSSDS